MKAKKKFNTNEILEIAVEFINTEGFEALTLLELAKKLNIKSPSLYNHFDGLNGLRQCLAVYGIEKLYNSLVSSVVGKSGDEALRALSTSYLSFVRENFGLYGAITFVSDGQDNDFKKAGDKVVDLIMKILTAYDLTINEQIHIVRGLRSLLHGFATLEKADGFRMELNKDESFNIIIDIFIKGIHSIKAGNYDIG